MGTVFTHGYNYNSFLYFKLSIFWYPQTCVQQFISDNNNNVLCYTKGLSAVTKCVCVNVNTFLLAFVFILLPHCTCFIWIDVESLFE